MTRKEVDGLARVLYEQAGDRPRRWKDLKVDQWRNRTCMAFYRRLARIALTQRAKA